MSIKAMTNIWDHSEQKGSKLLLLLAIADYADEYGYAWPSISTLSKKTRMSDRHTRRLLNELEDAGELYIDRRNYHNRYIITVGSDAESLCQILELHLGHDHDEAESIAAAFFTGDEEPESKHGDNLSPSADKKQGDKLSEHEDIPAQHEDVGVRHEDKLSEHEDIGVPLTVITPKEPSREPSEPSSAQARERDEAAPPDVELDPKIAAFMSVWETEIGGTLNAYMLDEITDLVDACDDINLWRAAIKKAKANTKYGNPMAYAKAVILNQNKPGGKRERESITERGGDNRESGFSAIPGEDSYQPPDIAEWFA